MRYWRRATSNAFHSTLPHFRDKPKRKIAFFILRTLVIYAVAFLIIGYILGWKQMIEEGTIALAFGLAVVAILFAIFLWNLLQAPSRMEKKKEVAQQQTLDSLKVDLCEKSERLQILEGERVPKIVVEPITGKRGSYESVRYTAWAELKVKNTSVVRLENVSVQIVELVQVYEKQDEQGVGTGIYHLHEPYPQWSPANVYWSERTTVANQFTIPISPNESQYVLIAFHHEHGSGIGVLNTPTHPPMLESRIVIEVSSPNMTTWRGAYYIEYRPPGTDKLEFVEWDSWCKSHKVIEQSTPDKGGSQT